MHLRPIWKGKLIWENALPIFERLPNASALTQLAPASLCSDVSAPCPDTSTRRRVCTDASVPTRPVRADASTRRLHRRVCTDASAPTRPGRRVYADVSTPTRLRRRVCPDASAPTRPRRRVHAEASAPTCLLQPVRADASAPTRQFRRVCARFAAPAKMGNRSEK